MIEQEKERLERTLWRISDLLRGRVGASEYKDYILCLIFYKYLSENWEYKANKILRKKGILYKDLWNERLMQKREIDSEKEKEEILKKLNDELGYQLPREFHFKTLIEQIKEEGEELAIDKLKKMFEFIRNCNHDTSNQRIDPSAIFEDLDLGSGRLTKDPVDRSLILARILFLLNDLDFQIKGNRNEVLGEIYEYLIGQFASGAIGKAGEFYSPQSTSTLLARLVCRGRKKIFSVYDPTCGSGSLLLHVGAEAGSITHYYGQEISRSTYNLSRMNMLLHGIKPEQFTIIQGDTLENPEPSFLNKRFDVVIANPPFSAHWNPNAQKKEDPRFCDFSRLAPTKTADFAFISHMLHHLSDKGTMAIVLPHGILFRGASEAVIRRELIEKYNYLDSIIGLPAKLFYGTAIPTVVLIFKKNRSQKREILFIDAKDHFYKGKKQNSLTEENIQSILEAYLNWESRPHFSRPVPLTEIAKNNYNLSLSRYLEEYQEESAWDLEDIAGEIKELLEEQEELTSRLERDCAELGIPTPF